MVRTRLWPLWIQSIQMEQIVWITVWIIVWPNNKTAVSWRTQNIRQIADMSLWVSIVSFSIWLSKIPIVVSNTIIQGLTQDDHQQVKVWTQGMGSKLHRNQLIYWENNSTNTSKQTLIHNRFHNTESSTATSKPTHSSARTVLTNSTNNRLRCIWLAKVRTSSNSMGLHRSTSQTYTTQ